ncbi:hypothetical protein [Herbaspirillum sp. ST 5-3]|uniref:hypothetical protein n=1 Tax=Oxalobacteraceae TaxID=75682 RepID=UPI0010A57380|nr:hypothetical protein [Herbaspirillum sp. ST 5-3]
MPTINVELNDEEYRVLSDEYKKMCIEWLHANAATTPPPFEQWLSSHLMAGVDSLAPHDRDVAELRIFNAIEKLIISLQTHGFSLAHLGRHGSSPTESAAALAQAISNDLALAHPRAKRIQELVEYYSKSPKEIADLAHVVITNRAYGALHEAYRKLVERTETALDHLDEEKALGRVEGAMAILVSLQVISRHAAKEQTEAFKAALRDRKK